MCTPATAEVVCDPGQVCTHNLCTNCTKSAECGLNYECKFGRCQHKGLFPPSAIDVVLIIICFLGAVVSSMGGTGGGGLYVPLFIFIGQFPAQRAMPLSSAMIFGNGLAVFLSNLPRRHPTENRPLILFDIALLMLPMMLGGSMIGVLLHAVFPSWMTMAILMVILGITTVTTFRKAMKVLRKEKAQSAAVKAALEAARAERAKSGDNTEITLDEKGTGYVRMVTPEEQAILDKEAKFPKLKLLTLFIYWLVVFIFTFLRGGKRPSIIGVRKCTPVFWVLYFTLFPLIFGAVIFKAWRLVKEHKYKLSIGYNYKEGDVQWTVKLAVLYPTICMITGLLCGLLGIGGGVITNPLLLALGLIPQVTAATGSIMVLFTAAMVVFQYFIIGEIPLDYGIFFICVGLCASFLGQFLVYLVIKKWQRTSMIIFALAAVILLSGVMVAVIEVGIVSVLIQAKTGGGFSSYC